jgi:DNA polymerase-3 subunit alpha
MNHSKFVHLRVHTEYSLIDGIVRVGPLIQSVAASGMCAVAVTDFCNLFAAIKIFQEAVSKGIKPIIGVDLSCVLEKDYGDQEISITLLCQNEVGYRNLTRLVSKAYIEGQNQGRPRIFFEWLKTHNEGLIVLSGGRKGDIGRALLVHDESNAVQYAKRWHEVFPNRFYLEIQRTNRPDEALYNSRIVQFAHQLNMPLVATNDVCFLNKEEFDAHEARVCIHNGCTLSDPKRAYHYSASQYLRSPEEMQTLFADLPEALQNTVEISKRCTVKLNLGHNYLPKFPVPNQDSVESYLSQLSKEGLNWRFPVIEKQRASISSDVLKASYENRLQVELDVINNMGFAGYFLIVADFIKWARENGVPVGPGRGSGAGSLVAYVLHITDIDPLQYDLLFERFLNPDRVSMPDFDIDFCMEGRDRVIEYVAHRYGRENVSQIITFGTMAAKAVIRDVGRVLGHPYRFVDRLAKLIPFELGITLKRAIEQEEELKKRYQEDEEVTALIDLALTLEGITRNAGKHAGGVVIAPSPLTDFTAIYCEQDATQWVSQFDKDDVEAVGLVKFDFLGLRTLTIIDRALKTINHEQEKLGKVLVDISTIPMDDSKTFDLLKKCETTAVFQVESRGMKDLIHRLQPDCFEEIIALVALFRPGPLQSGMVDDFIDRKHGRASVIYPHVDVEPILKPTYGVILYQEQVMQIAQVLANYTLGGADLLRRAMGKKKPEEMAKQRAIFIQGALENGVNSETSATIFDLMEKFAGYGFNKSHSAAYALLSYQTAWLKAHYPAAFMASVISSDMDNTEKVVMLIQECKRMGLTVRPPSIRTSHYQFTVLDEHTLIYGLGAIKGLGEGAIQSLLDARHQLQAQHGLLELCRFLDLKRVNRRVFDALIKSGCLDDFGVDRAILSGTLEHAMQRGIEYHQNQASRQGSLFEELDEINGTDFLNLENYKPWSVKERLVGEKETLGFYLSGHPADTYQQEFKQCITSFELLSNKISKKVVVCGILEGLRRVMTKHKKLLVILTLEDATNHVDVVVFSEIFELYESALVVNEPVLIECDVKQDAYTGGVKLSASAIYSLPHARSHFGLHLQLTLTSELIEKIDVLQSVLMSHPGECEIQVCYINLHSKVKVLLSPSKQWRVSPDDLFLEKLRAFIGITAEMCY